MAEISKAKLGFAQLKNSGAKMVLAEYLRERLSEKQKGLMNCNKDTFETSKGRCLELEELLTDLLK